MVILGNAGKFCTRRLQTTLSPSHLQRLVFSKSEKQSRIRADLSYPHPVLSLNNVQKYFNILNLFDVRRYSCHWMLLLSFWRRPSAALFWNNTPCWVMCSMSDVTIVIGCYYCLFEGCRFKHSKLFKLVWMAQTFKNIQKCVNASNIQKCLNDYSNIQTFNKRINT